jgi:hypothetical protein
MTDLESGKNWLGGALEIRFDAKPAGKIQIKETDFLDLTFISSARDVLSTILIFIIRERSD